LNRGLNWGRSWDIGLLRSLDLLSRLSKQRSHALGGGRSRGRGCGLGDPGGLGESSLGSHLGGGNRGRRERLLRELRDLGGLRRSAKGRLTTKAAGNQISQGRGAGDRLALGLAHGELRGDLGLGKGRHGRSHGRRHAGVVSGKAGAQGGRRHRINLGLADRAKARGAHAEQRSQIGGRALGHAFGPGERVQDRVDAAGRHGRCALLRCELGAGRFSFDALGDAGGD
jgi:hypothetical protein